MLGSTGLCCAGLQLLNVNEQAIGVYSDSLSFPGLTGLRVDIQDKFARGREPMLTTQNEQTRNPNTHMLEVQVRLGEGVCDGVGVGIGGVYCI